MAVRMSMEEERERHEIETVIATQSMYDKSEQKVEDNNNLFGDLGIDEEDDELLKALQMTMEQNDIDYVVNTDNNGNNENRDNFIEKLYWSKSHGIIRYEKKNNEVWELIARE